MAGRVGRRIQEDRERQEEGGSQEISATAAGSFSSLTHCAPHRIEGVAPLRRKDGGGGQEEGGGGIDTTGRKSRKSSLSAAEERQQGRQGYRKKAGRGS
jgi:hypothetical protein